MDYQSIVSKLLAVVRELDKVEVRGRANMKIITVCQDYLENMASELKASEETSEVNEE